MLCLLSWYDVENDLCTNVALVYKFVYTIGDYLSQGHIDILVRDEVEDPILCVPSANKPIVYTNL